MKSLNKLIDLKPIKIYPGHGPVVENAVEMLEMYVTHRNMREKQVRFLLISVTMVCDNDNSIKSS